MTPGATVGRQRRLSPGSTGEPGVAKPDPILVADGMRPTFGGVTAVDVDHLEVQRGVITALIGPNGAGKTTFFNLLTGFDNPDTGTDSFDGDKIDGKSPHELARRGMVRTFQLTKSLAKMSVIDNMKLGARKQRGESLWRSTLGWMWSSQEREIEEQADELLDRFRLDHMRDEYAGTLSGGQRKLLEMARALMVEARPDHARRADGRGEPGADPVAARSTSRACAPRASRVVFVEHDMDVVRDIRDWVVVMAEGSIIAEGSHDAIGSNSAVIDAYLGVAPRR